MNNELGLCPQCRHNTTDYGYQYEYDYCYCADNIEIDEDANCICIGCDSFEEVKDCLKTDI